LPAGVVEIIRRLPRETPPMAVLRTAVSALGCFEGSRELQIPALRRAALRLTAQVPAILATFIAHRRGGEARAPQAVAGHADHVLQALTDRAPDGEEAQAMDRVLTIHADHEFNASCFSARVTISTLSDLHAAITSGIGTLSGSLHGGANERVLELVARFEGLDAVEPFVLDMLRRKEKIPGFGQRGCRYEDPRALLLRDMAESLSKKRGTTARFALFTRLNDVMRRHTTLWPNVDFYSASVLDSLGVATDMFTPVFVCSRIVGWCAHVIEQVDDNVIIRPKGLYTGAPARAVPSARD
jgi:citrate synthase